MGSSFIEAQKFPCFEWSFKQKSCMNLSYHSYKTTFGSSLTWTGYYSTSCFCFASTKVPGNFLNGSKFVQKKRRQDKLEIRVKQYSLKFPRRDRNTLALQCQLFGSKSNKEKEARNALSEVEMERRRLVERIFQACSGEEQTEKVQKVVAAAGFLDPSQRQKLWFRIEQLSTEKLFEASVYNFERAAELRDESALLRLRDAHVILQESIDEALRRGELGFAKIFYEALQLVGEPPNLKKRIPSQGGETRTSHVQVDSCLGTFPVDHSNRISLSSATPKEGTEKQCPDWIESSDQTFVEPALGSLLDNQEMFGDALIDTEGMSSMNNTNECLEKVNNDPLKRSSGSSLFGLDKSSKDVIGYSNSYSSSSVSSVNSFSEPAANSDKDSKTGILGDKMNSSAVSYSEVFHHILKVELQGKWNMDRSSLAEHYLCFEYQIRIVNTGIEFIQLLSSNGFVETSDGQKYALAEQMIADRKPVVQDGEAFEYSSFCILQHPTVLDTLPFVGFLKMLFVFVRGDSGQQLFHLETSPVQLCLAQ